MIQVKNVTKKYGNFYAVKNINFEIAEGEIVGFLGQNGAGKTTTMNMITGFIEPTEGEIIVNGNSIDKKPKKVKKDIGYMPEGVPLYTDLTVKEFVSYMADLKLVPGKEKKSAVEKALKDTNLESVQNKLTRNLSRGYKQRVSLAGALVGDPKILILDEPTVGLDPKQVTEIRELIKSLGKNHTVLLSSHILSEVSQICEKVIIINKGEIIAVDTPANLEAKATIENKIRVTVEDDNNNFATIKEEVSEIKETNLIKESDDKTKIYEVLCDTNNDIRKALFAACAKKEIIIIEMKKQETSLEDAFIQIISNVKTEKSEESEELSEKQNEDQECSNNKKEESEVSKNESLDDKTSKESEKNQEKAIKEKIETSTENTNLEEKNNEISNTKLEENNTEYKNKTKQSKNKKNSKNQNLKGGKK